MARFQDEKELIRNLSSSMDGPEVIMDAEEYLQPKARGPLPSSSTVETPLPQTPVKKYAASTNGSEQGGMSAYGAEGFSSQSGSHTLSASPASLHNMGHLRDAGPGMRYCSDPLQLINKGTSILAISSRCLVLKTNYSKLV